MKKSNKKSLKRKNPIKSRKQQLINIINRCKTLKQLDGIFKALKYYPVLSKDFDWDYIFLLDIIEFKLKSMRDYFYNHNIVENEKQYGDICNTLINILYAGYKSDIVTDKDLKDMGIYVNTKNVRRFFGEPQLNRMLENDLFQRLYYLSEIRAEKAKSLFWKYMHHKIEYLWD